MSLRIIAGRFKGRILKTPKGSFTRPTQGVLREAIFNICQNEIEGARFLDLFAGSGAIGLEALSRGAAYVTFVENHRQSIAAIRENIAALKIEAQTSLIPYDAKAAIKKLSSPFDIVYIDPPYHIPAQPIVEQILSHNLLADGSLLFLEERNLPQASSPKFASLSLIGSRHFGEALLHSYHKQSGSQR